MGLLSGYCSNEVDIKAKDPHGDMALTVVRREWLLTDGDK